MGATISENKNARHHCIMCKYLYDDAEESLPFDELPDDWTCPVCGVEKDDFIEVN